MPSDLINTSLLGERGVALEIARQSGFQEGTGIGDVNGDGFDDIALAVRLEDDDPFWKGTLVVFGRPGFTGRHKLERGFPGTVFFHVQNDEAEGRTPSLSPLGDVNGDGYADFWIDYTTYILDPAQGRGVGFLVYGGSSLRGELFVEDVGESVPGIVFMSSDVADRLVGYKAANIGDFDGDGRADLAISAPQATNPRGESNAGVVCILSDVAALGGMVDLSEVGHSLKGSRIYGMTREPATTSSERRGELGFALEPSGDFDGDGLTDFLTFAAELWPRVVYLIRGCRDLPPVVDLYEWETLENVTTFVGPSDDRPFRSRGMSGLGDINADGFDDIVLGLSRGCCPAPIPPPLDGAAFIFYGESDFPPVIYMDLIDPGGMEPARWSVIRPLQSYSHFASTAACAGDLNGDGVADLLIGSPSASVGGRISAGETYAIFGQRDMPQELLLKEGFEGIRILGEDADDVLGDRLSSAGDFNGDGALDILVVATHWSNRHPGLSRAYIIYGTGGSLPPLTLFSAKPSSGPLRGGASVIITGSGFEGVPQVRFGDRIAAGVEALSSSELRVLTPPGSTLGVVDVTVTVEGVTKRLQGGYEYIPDLPSFDVRALGQRGFTLEGKYSKLFGYPAIAGIEFGDVTGDGVDDLIVETTESPGGWRVFVVHGGPGLPPWLQAYEPSPFLTDITSGEPRGAAGATVNMLGDVNGEDEEDLAIGLSDGTGYVLFCDDPVVSGELDIERRVEEGLAVRLEYSGAVSGSFHLNVVPVGDLTGDGIADFAVGFAGAPLRAGDAPLPGSSGGEILFVEGRSSWPSRVDLSASGVAWARLHGAYAGQRLAGALKDVGDVNGDGHFDLLADTVAKGGKAHAFLIYGQENLPSNASVEAYVEAGGGVLLELRDGFDNFDWFAISGAGDVNADTYSDFLLSVQGGGSSFEGMTYLIYGAPDLPRLIGIDEEPEVPDGIVRIVGEGSMEQAGRPGEAGDFNSDGYGDFIIGAPGFQEYGQEAGNVFLVFGGEELPPHLDLGSLGAHGLKVDGRNVLGGAGFFVGPSGDLDGDGLSDVAFVENAVLETDRPYVYVLFNTLSGCDFMRGDATSDGKIDVSDAIFILSHLFLGGVGPLCEDAADVDDGGSLNISDPIYLLGHLFLGGPAPPSPFPQVGLDPTEDSLTCLGF